MEATKRLSLPEYLHLCGTHFRRYWWQYSLPVLVVLVLQFFIRIDVNLTPSLPDHLFITVKGMTGNIQNGDYIAFRWHGGGPLPEGFNVIKIVAGTPGDVVRMSSNREFYITSKEDMSQMALKERFQGIAKTHSKQGVPLQSGLVGTIPEGQFYVYAPHPDSLDSRYGLTGWIRQEQIVGKSFALF